VAATTRLAQQARVVFATQRAAAGKQLRGHCIDGFREKTLLKEFHCNSLGYTAPHCLDVLQVPLSS
jgi:hypothetical protein